MLEVISEKTAPIEYPVVRRWRPTGSIFVFTGPSNAYRIWASNPLTPTGTMPPVTDECWEPVDITIKG